MKPLTDCNWILQAQAAIKSCKDEFLTNYYIDQKRCNLLIENELLYAVCYSRCIFILHKDHAFYRLYFISSNKDVFLDSLKKLVADYDNCIFLSDIVGTEINVKKISDIFSLAGFNKYDSLFRMRRTEGIDAPQRLDPRVEYAADDSAIKIYTLFEKYFDKYSEQPPLLKEIEQFIDSRNVLVIAEQEKILGFVIFEINKMTSYLRYWFVLPAYRDKKLGSILLRRFFHECRNTKRQLFWVLSENENAIARYKYYGFEEEPMIDQIMVKYPAK